MNHDDDIDEHYDYDYDNGLVLRIGIQRRCCWVGIGICFEALVHIGIQRRGYLVGDGIAIEFFVFCFDGVKGIEFLFRLRFYFTLLCLNQLAMLGSIFFGSGFYIIARGRGIALHSLHLSVLLTLPALGD